MEFIILIFSVVAGAFLYYLDMKKGRSSYTKWYNLSHKEPAPEDMNKGFVFKQPLKHKIVVTIVCTTTFLLLALVFGSSLIENLIWSMIVFVGLFVGFLFSPVLFKNFEGRLDEVKSLINKADSLEGIKEEKELVKEEVVDNQPKEEPKEKEIEINPEEEKKDDDWRDGVNEYLDN